jgi:hypothetical protein
LPLVPLAGTATVLVMLVFLDRWAWLLGLAAIGLGALAWLLSAGARARARGER